MELRRTNTRQFQNFAFVQLRSVLHYCIGARPQVFEALLLQPTQDFLSLVRRELFQFLDDFSGALNKKNISSAWPTQSPINFVKESGSDGALRSQQSTLNSRLFCLNRAIPYAACNHCLRYDGR
jgi:hypothetical protein